MVRCVVRIALCTGLISLAAFGCADSPQDSPSVSTERVPTTDCRAPAGVSNSPHTIAETVTLINALPKPLSLPCFLESLARPLEISASNSVISAQPAQGSRSPRIFVFQDPNVMSIVPAGDGASLLEFGEQRPEFRSLKGEITFPVTTQLAPSAPFDELLAFPTLTTCGGCHAAEQQESEISGVRTFTSVAMRPRAGELVSAASLGHELEICDPAREPQRCAMLDGLMGWGQVTDRTFPSAMSTFGGP